MKFCPECRTPLVERELNDRRRLICEECGFIYWNNPLPVAGAAIIDERGHILLVRRSVWPKLGYWNLPAGFMEFGESAESGALREVKEETGLDIEIAGFLTSVGAVHSKWPWSSLTFVFFYGHVLGGELTPGDDADLARYFAPDDLPEDIAFNAHKKALARWQEHRTAGLPQALGIR